MTAARVYAQLALGPVDTLLARIDRYQNWDRRLLRAVMRQLGVADFAHAIVGIGDNLAASLMTLMVLSELGIKDIWVKALTPEQLRFAQAGASRVIKERMEFGGQTFEAGQGVVVLFGSGNRDPEHFERADEFVIESGVLHRSRRSIPLERVQDVSIELAPGDILGLITDGVFETENPAGTMFGTEGVEKVLAEW